jgi:hypothetical protein
LGVAGPAFCQQGAPPTARTANSLFIIFLLSGRHFRAANEPETPEQISPESKDVFLSSADAAAAA